LFKWQAPIKNHDAPKVDPDIDDASKYISANPTKLSGASLKLLLYYILAE